MSGRGASWRAWLFKLHRDAGFLALGLTLVYGVSGVATNHKHDWNYNQSATISSTAVGAPSALLADLPAERREALSRDLGSLTREEEARLVQALSRALGDARTPKNAFWRGPDRLSVFYETGDRDTVDYHPSLGTADRKVMTDRPLLRSLNWLHLNEPGRAWTWVADAFAVVLVFLGLSGTIMTRGRHGLRGRGAFLAALGIALPLMALLLIGR